MAGIVFRIDKKPFSEEIEGVYAFCSELQNLMLNHSQNIIAFARHAAKR